MPGKKKQKGNKCSVVNSKACAVETPPEPQAVDCHTCTMPIAPDRLFGCDTPNCSYKQCVDCVCKLGTVCSNADCMNVHLKCPQCREQFCPFSLSDEHVKKEHAMAVLNNYREGMQQSMEQHHDVIERNMEDFLSQARAFGMNLGPTMR